MDRPKLCIIQKISRMKQPKPIIRFSRFLECNTQFRNEVSPALPLLRLRNVRTNARTTAKQLLGQNEFLFFLTKVLIQVHNPNCKLKTLLFNRSIHAFPSETVNCPLLTVNL